MAEPLLQLRDVRAGYGDAVVLDGISLDELAGRAYRPGAVHEVARAGIAYVPEGRGIFLNLTVEENLTVAARPGRWTLEAIYQMLPRLNERKTNMGNQLSGGEQQMLAVARTLMTNPSLLILDEPMEGLAPIIVEEIAALIRKMIVESSTTVILAEQHAQLALSMTENVVVLERGTIVHSAKSADMLKDTAAIDRYIGLRVAAVGSAART